MMPMTRIASVARLSASVWPEILIARACWTCGGATTATVRTVAFGSSFGAGLAASSVAALPTDENLPVPIHAANPASTTNAMSLLNFTLGMIVFVHCGAGRRLHPHVSVFGAPRMWAFTKPCSTRVRVRASRSRLLQQQSPAK